MVFSKLSGALRAQVFALLDRQSFSRLSRVSAQLRSFADYMYEHLSFDDHNARQVRRLLLLLIARPSLAERIRSVRFAPRDNEFVASKIVPESWEELQRNLDPIRVAMNNALAPSIDNAKHSMQWLGVLSTAEGTDAEDTDRRCAVAIFSLVASIANDLRSISFELDSLELGGGLCQIMDLARPELFSNLGALELNTKAELSVKITPSLEVLVIKQSWKLSMRLTDQQCTYHLNTLRISDARSSSLRPSCFAAKASISPQEARSQRSQGVIVL